MLVGGGYYWSSTEQNYGYNTYYLYFDSGSAILWEQFSLFQRGNGYSVRPVAEN